MKNGVNARPRRTRDGNTRSDNNLHRAPGAAAVALLTFAACLGSLRVVSSGDNIPTRLLPFSVLLEGDLDLDEFSRLSSREPLPYYVRRRGAHLYSGSGHVLPLLISPLYVPAALYIRGAGIAFDEVRFEVLQVVMERLCAAALAAAGAAILYLALLRLARPRTALLLTLAYALGSPAWSITGMALWPHGLTALVVAAVSYLFLGSELPPARAFLAGALMALGLGNRLQLAPVAVAAAAFAASRGPRALLAFAAAPALAAGGVIVFNLRLYGTAAGAYGTFDLFGWPLEGIAGLLFSPNRGLFIYCPLLLFAVAGMWAARRGLHPWLRFAAVGVVLHLALHGAFEQWWGGYTYGPRYLTGILPLLFLYVPGGLAAARRALAPLARADLAGAAALILALWGVAVQAVGVWCAEDVWNRTPVPLQQQPSRVWDWRDLQIVREARNGFHGADLGPLLASVWWQGRVPLRTLSPADLAARFHPVGLLPRTMPVRGRRQIRLAIENLGSAPWPAFAGDYRAHHRVFVVIRWVDSAGRVLGGTGNVRPLPRNVLPGEAVALSCTLEAPARPGHYRAEIHVAQAVGGQKGIPGPAFLSWEVDVG